MESTRQPWVSFPAVDSLTANYTYAHNVRRLRVPSRRGCLCAPALRCPLLSCQPPGSRHLAAATAVPTEAHVSPCPPPPLSLAPLPPRDPSPGALRQAGPRPLAFWWAQWRHLAGKSAPAVSSSILGPVTRCQGWPRPGPLSCPVCFQPRTSSLAVFACPGDSELGSRAIFSTHKALC